MGAISGLSNRGSSCTTTDCFLRGPRAWLKSPGLCSLTSRRSTNGGTAGSTGDLAPEVRRALTQTRDARARAVACLPPADAHVRLELRSIYESSVVADVFRLSDEFAAPDAYECAVRLSAFESSKILWREVYPEYRKLVEMDLQHQRGCKEEDEEFLRWIEGQFAGQEGPRRGLRGRGL